MHRSLPALGLPALETNHPFHFKLSPGVQLGPMCNHDIGVLIRFPSSATAGDSEQVLDVMLEAMGDHEFNCAVYSSKDAPPTWMAC